MHDHPVERKCGFCDTSVFYFKRKSSLVVHAELVNDLKHLDQRK